MVESFSTQNKLYLVLDYCGQGSLQDLIFERKYLSEQAVVNITEGILRGYGILEGSNILHRDLKPSNILIKDNTIKLADFGLSKILGDGGEMAQTMVGSPIYMSPEVLSNRPYNQKADIWSLGVLIYEMLFG